MLSLSEEVDFDHIVQKVHNILERAYLSIPLWLIRKYTFLKKKISRKQNLPKI